MPASVAPTRAASEIGVTAKTINIAVVADVDNPIAPNVFKGVVDGAQAGAKYVNANGGVAGRKLTVDFIDSHLNPNQTRNAIITACGQDLAMVGTATALFSGLDDLTGCKDKAGAATGLPDIGAIVLGTPEACAAVSFPVTPSQIDCSTVGQEPADVPGQPGPVQVPGQEALEAERAVHQDQRLARRGALDRRAHQGGPARRHRRHQHAVALEPRHAERVHDDHQQDEAGRLELVRQRPRRARVRCSSDRRRRCRG